MGTPEQERHANERRRQQAARLIADKERRRRARTTDELLLYEDVLRRVACKAPAAPEPLER
jgi:hypothetical protein